MPRVVLLFLLAGLPALTGCRDILTEPASAGPASLALSVVMPEQALATPTILSQSNGPAATPGAAFDMADGIRIRLQGEAGTRVDVDRTFRSEGALTRVRVEVDLDEEEEMSIELALLSQGTPLFEAQGTVRLVPGESTETQLTLAGVAARIEVAPESVFLDALGDQGALSGQGVFATGQPVPGEIPTWQSLNPEVARIVGGNRVEAVSNGQTQVVARLGSLAESVPVRVEQRVASVQVEPSAVELEVGGSREFSVALTDGNGFPVNPSGRSVQWASSAPAVASVDGTGRVTALAPGSTTVTAQVGGASGGALVTVVEEELPPDPPPSEGDLPGGWVAATWNGEEFPVLDEQDEECTFWIDGFGMDLAADGGFRMRLDQRDICDGETSTFVVDYTGRWSTPGAGSLRLGFTFARFFVDGELVFQTEVDFVELWEFRFEGDALVVDAIDDEEGEVYVIEMRRGEVVLPTVEPGFGVVDGSRPAIDEPALSEIYNLNSLKSRFSSSPLRNAWNSR